MLKNDRVAEGGEGGKKGKARNAGQLIKGPPSSRLGKRGALLVKNISLVGTPKGKPLP